MELYYATTNKGKVLSLQRELEKYDVKVLQVPMDIPEPRSSDVQEIAKEKVLFAYCSLKEPVVALDAGFYINSLNGFPRAFVNFAIETIGIEGILRLVHGKDRSCEFRECMAYMSSEFPEPKYFISDVNGTIADKPRGVMQKHLWSQLGKIFIPEESKMTLAEMTYDEYLAWRKISREKHSSSRQFAQWLMQKKIN